jgi:TolB-like protein
MELLEGESLDSRLNQGPLSPQEAVRLTEQMLSALGELHARGLVHRDLKPSNLYLTPHGAKLLDFGLARWLDAQQQGNLTMSGAVVGTPFYMAPEQALGRPPSAQGDLFSAGIMLYEMLAGKRPFRGDSTLEVLYAIVNEQPSAIGGAPEIEQLNAVIERALQKEPANRFQTAAEMVEALRGVAGGSAPATPARVRTVTRLIVLPFRMLVPDSETEFLAFSLPDALASTLSQIESLVVRSTLLASRFAADKLDLQALAAKAQVDAVLTGTLLRAGDQIRLSTQLIEVPGGTLLHSVNSQAPLRDLFRMQDELARQVVESLSIRLSPRDDRLMKRDVPASPTAYEYYLRGNQRAHDVQNILVARDLYLQCVESDPQYAPAWARLGRCHRVLGKFGSDTQQHLKQGEDAFQRALQLNPDLPLAHNLYAHLEADLGRAQQAMERLLKRARSRTNDAELFAGLVHVCRYCGLLNASLEAHERVRRIDPQTPTSVAHTYFMMGDYQRCLNASAADIGYVDGLAMLALGRTEELTRDLRARFGSPKPNSQVRIAQFMRLLLLFVEGKYAEILETGEALFRDFVDPEGHYYWARQLCQIGEPELALQGLRRVVAGGYFCAPTLASDPWLEPLRNRPEFEAIRSEAESRRRGALEVFRDSGGTDLLGVDESD